MITLSPAAGVEKGIGRVFDGGREVGLGLCRKWEGSLSPGMCGRPELVTPGSWASSLPRAPSVQLLRGNVV